MNELLVVKCPECHKNVKIVETMDELFDTLECHYDEAHQDI